MQSTSASSSTNTIVSITSTQIKRQYTALFYLLSIVSVMVTSILIPRFHCYEVLSVKKDGLVIKAALGALVVLIGVLAKRKIIISPG